jgi:lysophospholipase L1-like esterase
MKTFLNKVFLTSCLIFSLAVTTAFAQTAKFDTLYRPPKTQEIITKWKNESLTKKDYVFLGNSITAGTDWAKLLNLPQAKNRGISGDITYGVLARLQEIIDAKPAKIFILIGINDVSRNIPDSLIIDNYKKIISRIRKGSKKTEIYFNTLMPVNASFEKFKNHYGKDDHILHINDELRKMGAKKVTIIDLYNQFTDKDKHLRAELTKDGLHLIPEGYKVWADFLNSTGYLK